MSSSKSARFVNGYILVYDPAHENAMKSENWLGYVYLHIKVATEKYGRFLAADEVVHHIDMNKLNNHPNNLAIMKKADHVRIHNAMSTYGIVSTFEEQIKLLTVDRKVYCACGNKISSHKYLECETCSSKRYAKLHVSKEELETLVKEKSLVAIGSLLGVSSRAIRKRCIKFGIAFKKYKRNTKTL